LSGRRPVCRAIFESATGELFLCRDTRSDTAATGHDEVLGANRKYAQRAIESAEAPRVPVALSSRAIRSCRDRELQRITFGLLFAVFNFFRDNSERERFDLRRCFFPRAAVHRHSRQFRDIRNPAAICLTK
jgi:hypothetical protein